MSRVSLLENTHTVQKSVVRSHAIAVFTWQQTVLQITSHFYVWTYDETNVPRKCLWEDHDIGTKTGHQFGRTTRIISTIISRYYQPQCISQHPSKSVANPSQAVILFVVTFGLNSPAWIWGPLCSMVNCWAVAECSWKVCAKENAKNAMQERYLLWLLVTVMSVRMVCLQDGKLYRELFAFALKTYGILCFGLCRFRDSSSTVAENPSAKRYVITNPPDDFVLMTSDKVPFRRQLRTS